MRYALIDAMRYKWERIKPLLVDLFFAAAVGYSVFTSIARADAGHYDEATYRLIWAIILVFFYNATKKQK